jgi:hypothetical protein
MSVTAIVVAVIVVLIVAALAIWYGTQQRRKRDALREQFGPEYDRTVESYGGERSDAEEALSKRAERVASLHIRPLTAEQSTRYADAWHQAQTRFVEDPENAIREADRLCTEVLHARGYPMGDFEQRAADISVDHPHVVQYYRAAHAVAADAERGSATTEDLRQAMVHYRTLFEDLIETRQPAHAEG